MASSRTRESNKSFHLSPNAINALGSSAARRSLDKTSPAQPTLDNSKDSEMSTHTSHNLTAHQDESLFDSNTYSTRSNGKKRAITTPEPQSGPPTKRGRGRPRAARSSKSGPINEYEQAAQDAHAAFAEPPSPDHAPSGSPDEVRMVRNPVGQLEEIRIVGNTVYGPGTLIRHIAHIEYTEHSKPAAMGVALTPRDLSRKPDRPMLLDSKGQPVLGRNGEPLCAIDDVPDRVSTNVDDVWYLILLQDLCGAGYNDLLHRLNGPLENSKYSNRIMNYRSRNGKFSMAPNYKSISKGSLEVASKLTKDQLRFNTCWEINDARTMMRQPRLDWDKPDPRKPDEGWLPIAHPAGDFDRTNRYLKDVLSALRSYKIKAEKAGLDWVQVYDSEKKGKDGKSSSRPRRRASKANSSYDEDVIKVGEQSSSPSPSLEESSRAASPDAEGEPSDDEDADDDDAAAAKETPAAATTLDGVVRAMIGEQLAAVKDTSPPPRAGAGARQVARLTATIKALKGEKDALAKRVKELEAHRKWVEEAFHDLKDDVELLKRH